MIYIAFHFLKNKKWLRRHNYNSSVRAYINPLYEKEDTVLAFYFTYRKKDNSSDSAEMRYSS